MNSKKFIVITTINEPSEAIQKFASLKDWNLIVVGDNKTPKDWYCKNSVFLSIEEQEKMGFEILKFLPTNHYSRKMVGYLYAINNGAERIADSDDDNIPMKKWGEIPSLKTGSVLSGERYINIYNQYTKDIIWPRGFPLDEIVSSSNNIPQSKKVLNEKAEVWQFLADDDPDVDAIYRLTVNKTTQFKGNNHYIMDKGCFCPINSQNTFFSKVAFPLMYLPAFVPFRFTDILRGYVSQPILWGLESRVGFGPATVTQKRNKHNLMKDFESEIQMYLNVKNIVNLVSMAISPNKNIYDNLFGSYDSLTKFGITTKEELQLLQAWINDLEKFTNNK